MQEEIVLVNDNNIPIGTLPKLDAHNENTPLHRGFSCYIFNEKGKFLLTQRAKCKKVWPGIWTNSCCGHPALGEKVEHAVARRIYFELGLTPIDLKIILPDFRYRVELDGIVENEICPVFVARVDKEPNQNPLEVEAYRWVQWDDYMNNIKKKPDGFSEWSILQVAQLKNHPLIKHYKK